MFCEEGEFYSVDIGNTYFLVGGCNDEAVLYKKEGEAIKTIVDNLEESVMYVKILQETEKECLFMLATVGGLACLMTNNKAIEIVDLKENISFCTFINNVFYIGTEIGNVYVYSHDFEHLNTMSANVTVIDIQINNTSVGVLCENKICIGDSYGNVIFEKYIPDISSFVFLNGNVFAFTAGRNFAIYKEHNKLFETTFEEEADSVVLVDDSFVIGGSFDGIYCVNINNYSIYKIDIGINMIKDIKVIGKYLVSFIQGENKIGVLDIRDKSSLRLYESMAEFIFSYGILGNEIVIGGIKGYEYINKI